MVLDGLGQGLLAALEIANRMKDTEANSELRKAQSQELQNKVELLNMIKSGNVPNFLQQPVNLQPGQQQPTAQQQPAVGQQQPAARVPYLAGKPAIPGKQVEEDIPTQLYKTMRENGMSHNAAIGMLGNIEHESGFRPDVPGDNGNSYGLFQLNGPRKEALFQFARENNLNPADPKTQVAYVAKELSSTERKSLELANQAKSPEEAAQIWSENFFRPGNPQLDRRITLSRDWHNKFGADKEATVQQAYTDVSREKQQQVTGQPTYPPTADASKQTGATPQPGQPADTAGVQKPITYRGVNPNVAIALKMAGIDLPDIGKMNTVIFDGKLYLHDGQGNLQLVAEGKGEKDVIKVVNPDGSETHTIRRYNSKTGKWDIEHQETIKPDAATQGTQQGSTEASKFKEMQRQGYFQAKAGEEGKAEGTKKITEQETLDKPLATSGTPMSGAVPGETFNQKQARIEGEKKAIEKQQTGENTTEAAPLGIAKTAQDALKSAESKIFKPDGSVNRKIISWTTSLPETLGIKAAATFRSEYRQMEAEIKVAIQAARLLATGKTMNEAEIKEEVVKYMPVHGDNDATIKTKLDLLKSTLNNALKVADPKGYRTQSVGGSQPGAGGSQPGAGGSQPGAGGSQPKTAEEYLKGVK